MYNVKAYKNEVTFSEAMNEVIETEVLALDISGVTGHAFGTFTFTLLKVNGGAVIYRYDQFTRIEVEPIPEVAVSAPEDAPVH